jgi:hypothetical protein
MGHVPDGEMADGLWDPRVAGVAAWLAHMTGSHIKTHSSLKAMQHTHMAGFVSVSTGLLNVFLLSTLSSATRQKLQNGQYYSAVEPTAISVEQAASTYKSCIGLTVLCRQLANITMTDVLKEF